MSLSKLEKKTLILLANHGPLTGYDLHSKKKGDGTGEYADTRIMSDVHWLTVRKNLLEKELIKELPKEGRRKPYKLSENGFDIILRSKLDGIDDFEKFVSSHSEYLPLVFGLWENLKEYELDEYVKENLVEIIENIYMDIFKELKLDWRKRYSHDEFVRDIYTRIYIFDFFEDGDDGVDVNIINKINRFCDSNPAVKEFIYECLKEEAIKTNKKLNKIKNVRKNHLLNE